MLQRAQIQFTETGSSTVLSKLSAVGAAGTATAKNLDVLVGAVKTLGAAYVGLQGLTTTMNKIRAFDTTMLEVKAVTKATGEEFSALSEQARIMGYTTKYSASEGGEAILALSRNGFTAKESIDAVSSTLDLAIAGVMGLQEAADIAAISVRQFNLEAKDTARVADVIVTTANGSAQTVYDLAEAMKYAGGAANSLDIDIETTAASLGVLANSGIRGSMAGTALRSILLSLANPTEKAEKALAGMGLTIEDINPKTNSLEQIFGKLGKAQMDVAKAALIFDERSAVAAETLARYNGKMGEFIEKNKNAAGSAKEAASVMNSGINNSFLELSSVAEEAMLRIGEGGFQGALKGTIDSLTEGIKIVFDFSGAMEESSASGKIMAAVLGTIGTASMVASMKGIATAVMSIGTALKTAFNLNPWLVSITALASLSGALLPLLRDTDLISDKMNEAKESAQDQSAEFNLLAYKYEYLADKTNKSAYEEREFKKTIDEIKKGYPEFFGQLDMEKGKREDITKAIQDQKTSLIEMTAIKMREAELAGIAEEQIRLAKELAIVEDERLKKTQERDRHYRSINSLSERTPAERSNVKFNPLFAYKSDMREVISLEEDEKDLKAEINALQERATGITNEYGDAITKLIGKQKEQVITGQAIVDGTVTTIDSEQSVIDAIDDEIDAMAKLIAWRENYAKKDEEIFRKAKAWHLEYEAWVPKKQALDEDSMTSDQKAFHDRKANYEMEVDYYTDYKEMLFSSELEYQEKMKALKEQYGYGFIDNEKMKAEAEKTNEIIDAVESNASQSLTDMFTNAGSSFSDFLGSLSNDIIRFMNQSLVKSFFDMLSEGMTGLGGVPDVGVQTIPSVFPSEIIPVKRAFGGTYNSGTPLITGEYGWEANVPAVNGRILSHSDSMKAVSGQGNNPVNVKILNQVDEGMILQALNTREGEKLIINVISKYKNSMGL